MINKSERSQFPSIKLDQLVYVELESNNGGMMLSVSEEGFCFRAVTPVRPSGRMRFSFVIKGTEKLEGYGKVEWTQDDGKVAGLQFTDVSVEFLNTLRRWLTQMSAPAAHSDTLKLNQPSISESSKISDLEPTIEQDAVQRRNKLRPQFTQLPNFADPNDQFVSPAPGEKSRSEIGKTMPVLSEWVYPKELPEPSRPRIHGVVTVALVICFMALTILVYGYHQMVGQSLIFLGQKMSATPGASPSQPATISEAPKSSIEKEQPLPQTNSGKEQNRTSPELGFVTDSRYRSESASAPIKTENTVQGAPLASTTGESWPIESRSHDPAEQARSLWSAVAQGNTSAEVALAKLYLIGGGVTKNCDQARVLLQAAAKKRNGEAIDKLVQLEKQGCP